VPQPLTLLLAPLTAAVIKTVDFWDIMSCRLLNVTGHVGGSYHFHFLVLRIISVSYHREYMWPAELCLMLVYCLAYSALKVKVACCSGTSVGFTGLHGVICQKMVPCILT
jgi:hypothetical protein